MGQKQYQTGTHGVFRVAAELAAKGFIVSPTFRSAAGADLLVTDERCRHAFSVQVKTNAAPASFWLLNKNCKQLSSPSHIYVFVNLSPDPGATEFFIVPSRVVARGMCVSERANSTWYSFDRADAEQYRDRWNLFRKKIK